MTAGEWKGVMARMLSGEGGPFDVPLGHKDRVADYLVLGPVYRFSEVSQNEHVLGPTQFGGEDDLSIHEWWQAYWNWL